MSRLMVRLYAVLKTIRLDNMHHLSTLIRFVMVSGVCCVSVSVSCG